MTSNLIILQQQLITSY